MPKKFNELKEKMPTKTKSKAARRTKKMVKEIVADIGLTVHHNRHSEVTYEANPDDEWSRDSTTSSHSVDGISLASEYPDVTACFPVKDGDTIYLLYAVYSTGDSFGHDENSSIAYIDVFKTYEKAEKAAKDIRMHANWFKGVHGFVVPSKEEKKKYASDYQVDIKRENGKTMDVFAGWNGYFESLSYVQVESFVVGPHKRGRY